MKDRNVSIRKLVIALECVGILALQGGAAASPHQAKVETPITRIVESKKDGPANEGDCQQRCYRPCPRRTL
jgi:hypothetical protein